MAWAPANRSRSKASPKSLIFCASEHGWAAKDFHRMCNNVSRLLVIARSTSGYVFGGFTSVGFEDEYEADNIHTSDADAFLFTLINPHGIAPTKLAVKKHGKSAAICDSDFGAVVGAGSNGNDLVFVTNCNVNTNSNSKLGGSYSDSTGKGGALFTGSEIFGTMAEILAFSA